MGTESAPEGAVFVKCKCSSECDERSDPLWPDQLAVLINGSVLLRDNALRHKVQMLLNCNFS